MSKLTVDDLVQAQQRTENQLKEIAKLLRPKPKSTLTTVMDAVVGVISILVFAAGLFLAFQDQLSGMALCVLAGASRIERILSTRLTPN